MLTAEQFELALSRLRSLLETAINDAGARLTLSPVLQGPISKGELQVFYLGSRSTTPDQITFNNPWKQVRTIEFKANLLLKDLRNQNAAVPILETAKGLITGAKVFDSDNIAVYDGGLYPVSDRFSQLGEEAFWYYELTLACQIDEFLPFPYVPN